MSVLRFGTRRRAIIKNAIFGLWELLSMNCAVWRCHTRPIVSISWSGNKKQSGWRIFQRVILQLWTSWFMRCCSTILKRGSMLIEWEILALKIWNWSKRRCFSLWIRLWTRLFCLNVGSKDGSIWYLYHLKWRNNLPMLRGRILKKNHQEMCWPIRAIYFHHWRIKVLFYLEVERTVRKNWTGCVYLQLVEKIVAMSLR